MLPYRLQVRRSGTRAYQTVASAHDTASLKWGWDQCVDPRYSAGDLVRIVHVTPAGSRTLMRVRVNEP